MKKTKKDIKADVKLEELTLDLQRTRADFENYRKRMELEKQAARQSGITLAITKLLPTMDNIERAIAHLPEELAGNAWAQSVIKLPKQLHKSLESLELKRIDAKPGTVFDPALHEAVQMDEDSEGEVEVVLEELQAGYVLSGSTIRPAMVKVTRK